MVGSENSHERPAARQRYFGDSQAGTSTATNHRVAHPRLHFKWSQGDLTYRHLLALRTLEELKDAAPALYRIVLEYPWLADEIGPSDLVGLSPWVP